MPRHLVLIAGLFLLLQGCAPPREPQVSASSDPDELLAILRTGDHRLLDTLEPDPGTLGAIRGRDPLAPYALGRALEARGRDSTARRVYELELDSGDPHWAGLSAIRLARLARRSGNLAAAAGYADQARRLVPWAADAWFEAGTALYRDARYADLQELMEEAPASGVLRAGEAGGVGALRAEMALWQAVSAWEQGTGPAGARRQDTFLSPFFTEAVGPVHERLYLYLFYRSGALDQFAAGERALMDALYRYERGEYAEAARLISGTDAALLLGDIRETGGEGAEAPGIWRSLELIVRESGQALAGWTRRLSEAAAGASPQLQARVALIRSYLPEAGSEPVNDLLPLLPLLPQGGVRTALVNRLLELNGGAGPPESGGLVRRVEDLAGYGVSPEEFASLVDRSLPPLVRSGDWAAAADLLNALPGSAHEARARVALVLSMAEEAGLSPAVDAPLAGALEGYFAQPSTHTWLRMLSARQLGRPLELPPAGDPAEQVGSIPDAPAAAYLHYVLALAVAGLDRASLVLGMAAARDPGIADDALVLARNLAALGHTSNALDIARRATARSNRRVDASLLPLLYPRPYGGELDAAAAEFDLDRSTLTALVREESHFRPVVRSVVGAQGLGQLMPDTAEDIRRRMDWPEADAARPGDNLRMSAYYLSYLAEELEPPVIRLAAYNAGLGRGRRWQASFGDLPPVLQVESLPFVETRWYLRRIAASRVVYRVLLEGLDAETAVEEVVSGAIW